MREISLRSRKYPGLVVLVDDEDYERADQYAWWPHKHKKTIYAQGRLVPGDRTKTYLHQFLMHTSAGIDHKDGNGLNCQRDNLRPVTHGQNMQNRQPNANTRSGYKGVSWMDRRKPWFAKIGFNGQRKHLGSFATAEEAARAYDRAARKLFGEFARTNFKDGE